MAAGTAETHGPSNGLNAVGCEVSHSASCADAYGEHVHLHPLANSTPAIVWKSRIPLNIQLVLRRAGQRSL